MRVPDDEEGGFLAKQSHDTTTSTETSDSTSAGKRGWDPIPCNLVAYFGAAGLFMVSFNVESMPQLPCPLIGNLLPLEYQQLPENDHSYAKYVIALLVLWGFHFARRFGEVIFVHVYRRSFSPLEGIGVVVYYWIFGFMIGWACNIHLHYFPPHWALSTIGILLFLIGEAGNFICHLRLRRLRSNSWCLSKDDVLVSESEEDEQRDFPTGCCFNHVSSPHYFYEMITWLGYALASFTLPAFVFLAASCVTLCVYGRRRHLAYKASFGGRHGTEAYPANRKALIPYLF